MPDVGGFPENPPAGTPAGAVPNQAAMDMLKKAGPALAQFMMAKAQGGGQPQGGNPLISPGGVRGPGAPGPGGGGASPAPSANMPQGGFPGPQAGGSPMPGLPGFEFGSKRAAGAATAYGIMQNIIQTADKIYKKQDQLQQNEAEYLIQSYYDAINQKDANGQPNPDYAKANAIASYPRFKNIIKTARGIELFTYGEDGAKSPKEKALPTVAQRIAQKLSGIAQKLSGGQGDMSRNMPRPQAGPLAQGQQQLAQTQLGNQQTVANAQATALKDPATARAAATGTTLSGTEQHQAEMAAAGLWLPPAQGQNPELMLKSRQLDIDSQKVVNDYALGRAQLATQMQVVGIQQKPEYQRNEILKTLYEGQLSAKTLALQGKQKEAWDKMYKTSEDAWTKFSAQLVLLKKQGMDESDPTYKTIMDSASTAKDAMDNAEAIQDFAALSNIGIKDTTK